MEDADLEYLKKIDELRENVFKEIEAKQQWIYGGEDDTIEFNPEGNEKKRFNHNQISKF